MIRKTLSLAIVPTIIAMALLASPKPVDAAPPGHGGGGVHSGGFHSGGYYGGVHYGNVYHGGYSGVHSGYYPRYGYHSYPAYRYYSRPFIWYGYPYYFSSGYYPYYGYSSGYYPADYGYSYSPDWVYSSNGDSGSNLNSGSILITPNTDNPPTPSTPMTQPTEPANGSSNGQMEIFTSGSKFTSDGPAQITVRLPNNADLWFDGVKMTETGPVRVFSTPSLSVDRKYAYTIRIRWIEGDTTIDQTRKVMFSAGDKLDVSFPATSATKPTGQ